MISGTWFEFYHHSQVEGTYYNPDCRGFSEIQWREKLTEIRDLGMEYVVLMCASLRYADRGESYFPGGPYPFPEDMACKNPMEVLFDQCDRLGLKIFVSCGFYGDWTHARDNMVDPQVRDRAFRAMEDLLALYGRHPSFYGWYLPDEIGIDGYFPEFFIDYVNAYRAKARSLDADKKLLIAPYGVRKAAADEAYSRQLARLDCDYIAYQDGVGILNGGVQEAAEAFRQLRLSHDRAGGPALWADLELFRFEGAAYRSPLLPADPDRVAAQVTALTPYVDKILVYEYQGMVNRRGTGALCGRKAAEASYALWDRLHELNFRTL